MVNSMKRPFAVTFLGWLFIAVGLFALTYHLIKGTLDFWMITIVLFELVAVLAGVFLLKGRNWARWLLMAWVAIHVYIGAEHSLSAGVPHLLLFIAVAYFLFTPPDSKYFCRAGAE
jgi:hypothetical protein